MARCPRPPILRTPTLLPGERSDVFNAENMVLLVHIRRAALMSVNPLGMQSKNDSFQIAWVANAP